MPNATLDSALEAFNKTMGRVDGLLALHPHIHGIPGRPKQHVSDVLRGALVLAAGALDALVLDSVVAAVPSAATANSLGPAVEKWVKEDPERILGAFALDDPRDVLATLCREKLGALTFQKSAMIQGVLRDVLGCEPPWDQAAEILTQAEDEWDAERVIERLDGFVERRHRVAHGGDLLPDSTATRPIQRPYVERAAKVIRAVGQAVNAVTQA